MGIFLRQVVLNKGLPFAVKLPEYKKPPVYEDLTKEQLAAEIQKGLDDIREGRVYTEEEVKANLRRKFGIDL